MTGSDFRELPLLVQGESKEVRQLDKRFVVIRMIPSIFSFTANRAGIVEGSDVVRCECAWFFAQYLNAYDIKRTYEECYGDFILSRAVVPCDEECRRYNVAPFRDKFFHPLQSNPIEVVVKAAHVGTPKHRYYGMQNVPMRKDGQFRSVVAAPDAKYPHWYVRFDWRNPLRHPEKGTIMADEAMPDDLANFFINTQNAKNNAIRAFRLISDFLAEREVDMLDICFFMDTTGEYMFGEISPDCGRFRRPNGDRLDKDLWREGSGENQVLVGWQQLLAAVQRPTVVVDGNDGTGKTTVVGKLRELGYIVRDRGRPTEFTDKPTVQPVIGEKYVIIDATVEESRRRLLEAGKDLNELFHTEASLRYYRDRFRYASEVFECPLIDGMRPLSEVIGEIVQYVGKP